MDPDLTRLCAIPGNDDLTCPQVEDILQLSRNSVQRLTTQGRIEIKRHAGRGQAEKGRVRIPRAAIVRYLVLRSGGDRAVILAAVRTQCPHYLPAVADLLPGAAPATRPANVIPMRGRRARAESSSFEHPDLFRTA